LVEAAAARYKVDADLITSVIAVESNSIQSIVAQECARADATLTGDGGGGWECKTFTTRRRTSMRETRYLRELLQMYNNDLALALAAYNAGPARAAIWPRSAFAETLSYVRRVKRSL